MILLYTLFLKTKWLSYLTLLKALNRMPTLRQGKLLQAETKLSAVKTERVTLLSSAAICLKTQLNSGILESQHHIIFGLTLGAPSVIRYSCRMVNGHTRIQAVLTSNLSVTFVTSVEKTKRFAQMTQIPNPSFKRDWLKPAP